MAARSLETVPVAPQHEDLPTALHCTDDEEGEYSVFVNPIPGIICRTKRNCDSIPWKAGGLGVLMIYYHLKPWKAD
jgi:hypothetical protein